MSTPLTRHGIYASDREPGAFCLACDMYLGSDEEAWTHINSLLHESLFKCAIHVSQYESDCIKRINNYYFCEVCNYVADGNAGTREHMKEQRHKDNLKKEAIRRERNIEEIGKPVVVRDIKVSEEAWNSFMGTHCLVCNIPYDNYNLHRYNDSHIIKIIQGMVYTDNGNVYRQVKNSFQCLNCNVLIPDTPGSLLREHFNSEEHKKSIDKCRPGEAHYEDYFVVGPNPFKKPALKESINVNIPPIKMKHPFNLEID